MSTLGRYRPNLGLTKYSVHNLGVTLCARVDTPTPYDTHTMGSGTKKCTICNTSNAAALLFLCEGIFCRRTTVDWKMINHYSTAGPNMLIRQKWLMDERGCGEERFVKGELFVCMQCAKGAIEYCENVLGY